MTTKRKLSTAKSHQPRHPDSIVEQLGISYASLTARGLHEYKVADSLEFAEIGADGKEYQLVPAAAVA